MTDEDKERDETEHPHKSSDPVAKKVEKSSK
jgi:hypothetical protein